MEPTEVVGGTAGHATWTSTWSAFVLSHLANLVVDGTRTSSTHKMVHYNATAKALKEKFGIVRTGDQVKNHLKTLQKKYRRICELRALSAAGWDDATCTITMDPEHYNSYVLDHKSDAEYLNKPIQHFTEMHIIWGSTMATGKFAKDSSAPLGTEDGGTEDADTEDGAATLDNSAATSSASKSTIPEKTNKGKKTNKRARTENDPLIAALNRGSNKIAKAIIEVAKSDKDVPEDLLDNLMALNGTFNETHLSLYHNHLVSNPHIARAFNKLSFQFKLNWVAKYIADNFPGQ